MILCSSVFTFELHDVHTLKGRRSVTNAIKGQLKNLNVSVLDISSEYSQEAAIAVAFLAHDARSAQQIRQNLEALLERHFPEHAYEMDFEEI